jgi:hypothetical protein
LRRTLPPYAVCRQCGETASAALLVDADGQVICLNCRDVPGSPRRLCMVCDCILPIELHHVASRINYPTLTTPLCLNCHQMIYARQVRWRRDGSAERHPLVFLVVGALDMVWLFLERSPAATACRQLLMLLGRVAVFMLGSLRIEAMRDINRALEMVGETF